MIIQAGSLFVFLLARTFLPWLCAASLLGLGTAMVYPTLLAAIGDVADPSWRASSVGVYRLWRDGGYAAGALLAGTMADVYGMGWAIGAIGALTLFSGLVVARCMRCLDRLLGTDCETNSLTKTRLPRSSVAERRLRPARVRQPTTVQSAGL